MTASDLDRALAAADRRHGEYLPLLERWVRVNSFTGNLDGCNRTADLLIEDFALPDLTVARLGGRGTGDHLVWRTPAWEAAPGRRLVLIGHHDTVFPPGVFERWELDGELLRGPGVLDMKGGLAVVRTALAAVADAGLLAALPLAVVSVADEETGSSGSRTMLEDLARGAAAALVFEAGRTTDQVVTRRKGTGKVSIIAHGKAAHAGNDLAAGVNAIWALARVIDGAQRLTDLDLGATVNVGVVHGGTSANTVPAEARCELDLRFVRSADGPDLVARLGQIAAAVGAEHGARIAIEGGVSRLPLERTAASSALAARYGADARAEGLGAGEAPLMGGGSDANTVSAVGVPAIDGLGPRGRGFHTLDEHIELATVAPRVRALVRFLVGWATAPAL
jgi:glutamate carboxypeptidase